MKIKILLSLFVFLFLSNPLFAQTNKSIILKDGTVLKGRVVSMENGVYTIQTPYLNELQIEEGKIESIAEYVPPPVTQQRLKTEVQQVQGQVMANPLLMEEIQKTMQDPEVQAIMNDPAFINAIMSMDPESIKSNPKTYEMLQNPKIRELFQKIESTLDHHSDVSP